MLLLTLSLIIMAAQQVVPTDVVDNYPETLLDVVYPSGIVVNDGNQLKPSQVQEAPTVNWNATCDSELYTLVMIDPDAPVPGEVKHWLVINIPGSEIEKGSVVAPYKGSKPPKGSGIHRYIFLLFKQKTELKYEGVYTPKGSTDGRYNFSARDFAKSYNLGDAVAANFYRAEYEPFVDEVNAQDAKAAEEN